MKKILALLLVAVMCVSFAACDNTSKKDIVGTWTPTEDSVLAGYTFIFNEDGTGTVKNTQMRWKYDNDLSCYIVANASGEVYSILDIMTDDNGERYFKISGSKFYYQD